MDAGFIKWLAEKRGFQPGDTIATRQQYDAMYKQYLNDASGGGGTFSPKTGMATNEATGEVTPYFMNSANSAQVLPEGRFKEGPVDKDGTQLVFDPSAGNYFPATNAATGTVVKPSGKKAEVTMMDVMQMSPEQKKTYYDRLARGEDPAAGMPSPTPMPDPGMTNSMAFQGVPSRGNYETNMPTGVAAPVLSSAMGAGPGISMTPVARATAVTNPSAPAAGGSPAEIRAAYQRGAISKDDAIRLLRGGS